MKAVDVDFKKIDVVDYYPQFDQTKIRIVYDDGTERAFIKQVPIEDPDKLALEWFSDIRSELKSRHKEDDEDDHPLAGTLILRFKQEEDVLQAKISRFLGQVRERIRSCKMSQLSYYDIEKELTKMSAGFQGRQ